MFDETNLHTLITQVLATVAVIIGVVHPGTSAFTLPDALVTSLSVVGAAIASGLHALHVHKTKTVTTVPTRTVTESV